MSPAFAQADLSVGSVSVGAIVANQNGSWTIPVTYTVTNVGTVNALPNWFDMAYLSADAVLDNADQAAQGWPYYLNYRTTALAPGASYTITANFVTTAATAPGSYTIFVKADGRSAAYGGGTNSDNGALAEAAEANNVASASVALSRPDLSVGSVSVGAIVANQNGSWTIPVTYTVTNVGTINALPNWLDMAYLSSDAVLDNSDQPAQGGWPYYLNSRTAALAPGASYTVTANFVTTSTPAPGNYTVFVKADGHSAAYGGGTNTDNGNVAEVAEANNVASASVALSRPDLSVGSVSVGAIVANQNGSWTIPVTTTAAALPMPTTARWPRPARPTTWPRPASH